MPLTETEAQELIAEIKRYFENPMINCSVRDDVEKIINRFANRPPYGVYIPEDKEPADEHIVLLEFKGFTRLIATSKFHGETSIDLNPYYLKQLRDNCNSMLEYLNND